MQHFMMKRWRVPVPVSVVSPGQVTDKAPGRGRLLRVVRNRAAGSAVGLALLVGAAQACADVALILAIDASGSVDAAEFGLQQQGYARAFRSGRVQAALAAAGVVDVGIVLWGDTAQEPQVVPMARLQGAQDAMALADRIARLPRRVTGNTGIGRGVWAALDLLLAPGTCAHRRIVNVSGDGIETRTPRSLSYVPLSLARERAAEARVTINALAIRTGPDDLGAWYESRLITGPGAFVMQVDGFGAFAAAIEAKLVREIEPAAVSWLLP